MILEPLSLLDDVAAAVPCGWRPPGARHDTVPASVVQPAVGVESGAARPHLPAIHPRLQEEPPPMTVEAHKETLGFQAEVRQLLDLMIHSLYSNKEIFLRELVSNAADAADKLRFEALGDDALYEGDGELRIRLEVDKTARTVSVTDNGIGMSRQEVQEHLGTIARSGTREFVSKLSGDQAKDSRLIGQFGVGFYSAFIVADRVTVETRRAGLGPEHGVRWISAGEGEYTLETIERAARGTTVTLHLREGEEEFLEPYRLKSIVTRYSDHVPLPIEMLGEPQGEGDDAKPAEWETVNRAAALWMRPKSEISDAEYNAFYQHVAHDFEDPLLHMHNRVEGKHEYSALLYIPRRAPFDLWDRERRHGIKLYVRRVFIMDDAEHLMPGYLRFVRGVIDSDDLPLNVSREILQHNRAIDAIRGASVKRVLGRLETLATEEPERYAEFWAAFGKVLKEGPGEDHENRERIARLLRFASTRGEGDAETVSLETYVERMVAGQEKIYYITADTFAAAANSPHLEVFRKQGVEVLLLHDRIDEWLVSMLPEFAGKTLQSVSQGELELAGLDEADAKRVEQAKVEHGELVGRVKKALGDRVERVRFSARLTDSPACLVAQQEGMSAHLGRLLKAAGQEVPQVPLTLELNPDHRLVTRLEAEQDEARFGAWAELLYEQALLSEGGQLSDPAGFVRRMNGLLLELAG
jgi:molecular chaperone HtpG